MEWKISRYSIDSMIVDILDSIRGFWNGKGVTLAELATRIAGSSDLYCENGRSPHASINFITAHDGFTLQDLVSFNGNFTVFISFSYLDKHNEANRENNQDGTDNNHSWNHGDEGPTDDPRILSLRHRQVI